MHAFVLLSRMFVLACCSPVSLASLIAWLFGLPCGLRGSVGTSEPFCMFGTFRFSIARM